MKIKMEDTYIANLRIVLFRDLDKSGKILKQDEYLMLPNHKMENFLGELKTEDKIEDSTKEFVSRLNESEDWEGLGYHTEFFINEVRKLLNANFSSINKEKVEDLVEVSLQDITEEDVFTIVNII